MPVDFDLFEHENERQAARTHLDRLSPDDVIVYDRGYYSFAMGNAHFDRQLNFVFRVKRQAGRAVEAFITSPQTEARCQIDPPTDTTDKPLTLRLVKYTEGNTQYCLATSLPNRRYRVKARADLYRQRGSVEELYLTNKDLIEFFHRQSNRGVRQELYASFILMALTRIDTNRCEQDINGVHTSDRAPIRSNFKNALRVVGKEIEALLLHHLQTVVASLTRIMTGVSQSLKRERPNRSYRRVSKKPRSKWT